VYSLCEKEEKTKINLAEEKNLRECCSLRICRLRSMDNNSSTTSSNTDIPGVAVAYNKAQVLPPASADLHVDRHAIRTNGNVFALCEKRVKEKRIS
jgi:hypothetical protein